MDVLGDVYVFRGTTEGFAGNPVLQQLGLSPTSIDPLVSTVFAAEGAAKGAKPMILFGRRTAFGETLEMGNVRNVLEREVAVPMAPTEFAKTAPNTISLERARAILKDMGFDVPPSFASGMDATTFLHNSKRMTPEQIKLFIERATGGR